MTYRSAWISLDDGGDTPWRAKPEDPPPINLPDATGGSLRVLKNWAESAGVELEWVDNAWLFVSVDRGRLSDLLAAWVGGDVAAIAAIVQKVDAAFGARKDGPFLVHAEEF